MSMLRSSNPNQPVRLNCPKHPLQWIVIGFCCVSIYCCIHIGPREDIPHWFRYICIFAAAFCVLTILDMIRPARSPFGGSGSSGGRDLPKHRIQNYDYRKPNNPKK
jgi:hypothetical protein